MPENIKNQFNESTLNNPVFHIADGGKGPDKLLTTASAAVPASFLGREKELTDIRSLLTRQNTLVLVNAEGGMGKTTLAARYWQLYEHEYNHLAWLFCKSGILSAMRNQLPDALGLREAMNQYADNPDRQVQALKTAMANLPKDCLLVLDNANDPEHIRGFQQQMTGLGWHVLITSRCSKVLTDAASEYRITGLPPAQAKELFKNNHDEGTPEFEALLDRFLHAVDYNTLCIEVFSKNLREGAALDMTLAGLLEKLEKNGLFLGNDSFEIQTDYVHNVRKEAVKSTDQVIEALYDVADLQRQRPELHDLLVALALLPAENHPPALLGALLAPDDKPGLKRRLDQLAQKGWLATDTSTYRISPVLQKILLHRNTERRWELGEPMVLRLHVIFETEGYHPKNIATAGPFAALVFGLAENLDTANKDLSVLFHRLWVYLSATGNLAKALDAASQMRHINERTGDDEGLAISYSSLGDTHTELANLDQALTFFEKYNQLKEELYAAFPQNVSYKNGLAISYSKLGDTHTALGNLDRALTFFEQFSQLEKELHEAFPQNVSYKNGLAVSYERLGDIHSEMGNLEQVLTFFEDETKLKEELYAAFPQNVSFKNGLAISYSKLGDTHTALGNLEQAVIFFEQFGQLEKELLEAFPQSVEFKNGLAISYSRLGETHTALGNLDQALTFFEKDNELSKEHYAAFPQNVSFKNGLAISYSKLGETHTALGNVDQALTFFEQFNQLEKELHEAFPQNVSLKNGLAVSYSNLGRYWRDQKGDKAKARTYLEQCHQLWKALAGDFPSYAEFQKKLRWAEKQLSDLET